MLVSIAELERVTIYTEVTKSRPLNDVNAFEVDHPLWARPRTWPTFRKENTHDTRTVLLI